MIQCANRNRRILNAIEHGKKMLKLLILSYLEFALKTFRLVREINASIFCSLLILPTTFKLEFRGLKMCKIAYLFSGIKIINLSTSRLQRKLSKFIQNDLLRTCKSILAALKTRTFVATSTFFRK